jgi:hypothetical protein
VAAATSAPLMMKSAAIMRATLAGDLATTDDPARAIDPQRIRYDEMTRARAAMGRRIEFGAGVATVALAVLAALLLVFAPLLPYCATAARVCAASEWRYRSLLQSGFTTGDWALALLPGAVAIAGGLGAIVDARLGRRAGLFILGIALMLGLAFCVLGITGLGIIYLPSIMGLGLASYGALLSRRSIGTPHDVGE